MTKNALMAGACLAVFAALTPLSAAVTEVTVHDTDVYPESITSTADGSVIFGSSTKPIIYRSAPGAATAEPWIHVAGEGAGTNGVLVNAASHTLWACVHEPVPGAAPIPGGAGAPPRIPQHSFLRGFDLTSGAVKSNYPLLGDTNGCNDISVGPDRSVYVTDAPNARIERLAPGGTALELWDEDKADLTGLDGVDVMNGKIYANNIRTGKIYRIPVGPDGKPLGAAVEIKMSTPLTGPDGMRSQGGRMFVADNRANQVDVLDFDGDTAKVTLLKGGFQTPSAVAPTGDVVWVGEAKFNYRRDPSLGNPNPFKAYALPVPPK